MKARRNSRITKNRTNSADSSFLEGLMLKFEEKLNAIEKKKHKIENKKRTVAQKNPRQYLKRRMDQCQNQIIDISEPKHRFSSPCEVGTLENTLGESMNANLQLDTEKSFFSKYLKTKSFSQFDLSPKLKSLNVQIQALKSTKNAILNDFYALQNVFTGSENVFKDKLVSFLSNIIQTVKSLSKDLKTYKHEIHEVLAEERQFWTSKMHDLQQLIIQNQQIGSLEYSEKLRKLESENKTIVQEKIEAYKIELIEKSKTEIKDLKLNLETKFRKELDKQETENENRLHSQISSYKNEYERKLKTVNARIQELSKKNQELQQSINYANIKNVTEQIQAPSRFFNSRNS